MNILFRTIVFIFSICCLVPLTGCAEEDPAEVREFSIKYFRHKLFDLTFVDPMTGWICGDYGLIWKTADGGNTWKPLKSQTILPLRGISFTDNNRGWAVGDQGTILHTEDGGEVWTKQDSGITEHLQDVVFLNDTTGIAIGVFAALVQTEDGGAHWSDISSRIKEEEKELQFFITEGDDSEEETEEMIEDEDIDFMEEGMPVLEPLLNDIFFVNDQTGWIVGEEGSIFYTRNAGKTWKQQKSGSQDDLFAVYFKNPQEGWITGLNGLLLHTQNSGEVWEKQQCPVEESLFGIVVTETQGYAVGNAASMVATSDGGKTWLEFTPRDLVLYSWFRALEKVDGKFFAIGGLGTVLICDDENQTWRQIL